MIGVLALFLFIPSAYFLYIYSSGIKEEKEVKGASVSEINIPEKGLSVNVSSKVGTWEMYQYLCDTKDDCLESLMSGTRLGTVGGGVVSDYTIKVVPNSLWEGKEYLKLFIKSGWGSPARSFKVTDIGGVPGTEVENTTYEGITYELLLVPADDVTNFFYNSGSFSD